MRPLRYTDVSASFPNLPQDTAHVHDAASFPVERSFWPPFSRGPQRSDHGHAHGGGKVPLDLDEAAYGAKCAATNVGPWFQRAILGGGIYYAFDGSLHALKDLRAWPQANRAAAHINNKLAEPIAFKTAVERDQRIHARSNHTALQRIASAHSFNSYAGGILAAASFVGCLFMGLSLAFDDQMLGYMLPSLVNYTGTCMNMAVPMMVIYALGVAATAGWDLIANWGRADKLAGRAVATEQLNEQAAQLGPMQNCAYGVAERSISRRQKLSGMATVAGAAMGVGIGLTCWVSTWGLALMLPGALSLPGIMAARHKPKVDLAGLAQGVNKGSIEHVSNDLVHLDKQMTAVKEHVHADCASFLQHRIGRKPQYSAPIQTVDALIKNRLFITNEHLRQLRNVDVDRGTFTRNIEALQKDMATRQLPTAAPRHAFLCEQMLDTLVEDGVFEDFAFEVAKSAEARKCLIDVDGLPGVVNVSIDRLRQVLTAVQQENSTEKAALENYTRQMATHYLKVVATAGYRALNDQKEEVLDLWLARVD